MPPHKSHYLLNKQFCFPVWASLQRQAAVYAFVITDTLYKKLWHVSDRLIKGEEQSSWDLDSVVILPSASSVISAKWCNLSTLHFPTCKKREGNLSCALPTDGTRSLSKGPRLQLPPRCSSDTCALIQTLGKPKAAGWCRPPHRLLQQWKPCTSTTAAQGATDYKIQRVEDRPWGNNPTIHCLSCSPGCPTGLHGLCPQPGENYHHWQCSLGTALSLPDSQAMPLSGCMTGMAAALNGHSSPLWWRRKLILVCLPLPHLLPATGNGLGYFSHSSLFHYRVAKAIHSYSCWSHFSFYSRTWFNLYSSSIVLKSELAGRKMMARGASILFSRTLSTFADAFKPSL